MDTATRNAFYIAAAIVAVIVLAAIAYSAIAPSSVGIPNTGENGIGSPDVGKNQNGEVTTPPAATGTPESADDGGDTRGNVKKVGEVPAY